VNSLEDKPDFIVFTGDLTQTTDDPKVRRQRLAEFRDQAAGLKVPKVYSSPASTMRRSTAARPYQEVIGGPLLLHLRPQGHPLHRARQHLRSRAPCLGEKQIEWLSAISRRQGRTTHRRVDAPSALPVAAAMGLGDARRHGGEWTL
jgi:3',5'-cyclic AMP phosphodiesterase CpdA